MYNNVIPLETLILRVETTNVRLERFAGELQELQESALHCTAQMTGYAGSRDYVRNL